MSNDRMKGTDRVLSCGDARRRGTLSVQIPNPPKLLTLAIGDFERFWRVRDADLVRLRGTGVVTFRRRVAPLVPEVGLFPLCSLFGSSRDPFRFLFDRLVQMFYKTVCQRSVLVQVSARRQRRTHSLDSC